jgi:hypothetical protein
MKATEDDQDLKGSDIKPGAYSDIEIDSASHGIGDVILAHVRDQIERIVDCVVAESLPRKEIR